MADTKLREKATDSWYRELTDGKVEIVCRAPGYRIRVCAPEQEAWEAVEMFERWTGLTVTSERRPRKKAAQLKGQLPLVELTNELESGGSDG